MRLALARALFVKVNRQRLFFVNVAHFISLRCYSSMSLPITVSVAINLSNMFIHPLQLI
jgi:hypothetical protein